MFPKTFIFKYANTQGGNTMKELSKVYDPKQVEDRTYQFWLDGGSISR